MMRASAIPARITTLLAGLALAAAAAKPAAAKPAAAKPFERRLYPYEIEASSFLWNDANKFLENYHPNYVADDDPATAWVEGAKSSGAGEWLRLWVGWLEKTTQVRLRVRNGDQRSNGGCGPDLAWVMRTQPKEGPGRVEAIALGRCKRIRLRVGWYVATMIELMIYDPTGKLVLVAGSGNVEGYRWTMDGGKPMLASVRSMLSDGRILEAKRPTPAAAP